MRIAFCSIDALTGAIEAFDPTVLISVYSPQHPIRDIGDRLHLHLAMHDVEERSLRTCGKTVPDHRHIGALLDLIAPHQPERILVHCTAGLSRSPAIAIVAAVQAGHVPASICANVRILAPHVQPNRELDLTTTALEQVS